MRKATALVKYFRETRLFAGADYFEGSIIPKHMPIDFVPGGKLPSRKKVEATRPAQKTLNDENSRRYFRLLMIANFFVNTALHITLTYNDMFLPAGYEDAEKRFSNFMRKVNANRKRRGQETVRFLSVVQWGSENGRIHHHLIIENDGYLNEQSVRDMWSVGRGKNKQQLGFVDVQTIQDTFPGEHEGTAVEKLANYFTKDFGKFAKGNNKWSSSRGNLVKPEYQPKRDYKFSRAAVMRRLQEGTLEEYIREMYPDYELLEFTRRDKELVNVDVRDNMFDGIHIYFRMRRITT
ncbi:hypothetical protein EQG49_12695 [Periweissella cryptocerci]|uniref:Replication-associated protein ORF2/G2P domain-containing protein n=1 Tax=Periweissella cryptocerci TaxID=2506420 RepID=A0A4P6YWS5_9LACO|nr:hypothetical protein [Periweissella cryptocerci]QBO37256.1 hypothetical protein EQG49_12695 [Periweissella cryptocerci]